MRLQVKSGPGVVTERSVTLVQKLPLRVLTGVPVWLHAQGPTSPPVRLARRSSGACPAITSIRFARLYQALAAGIVCQLWLGAERKYTLYAVSNAPTAVCDWRSARTIKMGIPVA